MDDHDHYRYSRIISFNNILILSSIYRSAKYCSFLIFVVLPSIRLSVSFVSGFAMYFNLPRIMFGRLQSRLFPIYFATTLVLSCVTFVTFTIRHPYETMTSDERKQV